MLRSAFAAPPSRRHFLQTEGRPWVHGDCTRDAAVADTSSGPTGRTVTSQRRALRIGCAHAAGDAPTRGRDRLPGDRVRGNVGSFSGGVPARLATELLHVAAPAGSARVVGP